MRVLIDQYVPFLRGVLEPFAEVCYLAPDAFTSERVRQADALIVRTRTRCDASLLHDSSVRCIASATIGYDHIDTAYCCSNHIAWYNAPGCNAQGVCDYVESAILYLQAKGLCPLQPVVGIVGVGHVGHLVEQMAHAHGWYVLKNDPYRALTDASEEFHDLSVLAAQADVLTFHTPMSRDGQFPSYHLCDMSLLQQMKPKAVVINAARGGVVDESALLRSEHPFVLDTWENEPNINRSVLDRALVATPHIAGYTLQGKINASNECLKNVCTYFGWPVQTISMASVPMPGDNAPGWLLRVDKVLRNQPSQFEQFRETYKLR